MLPPRWTAAAPPLEENMTLRTWLILVVALIIVAAVALVVVTTPGDDGAGSVATHHAARAAHPSMAVTAADGPLLLGSRAVPGYRFTVERAASGPLVPGGSCPLHIRIEADAGGPAPARVEAWAAVEPSTASEKVVAVKGDREQAWTVAIPLPAPVPAGLSAWVRATMPDGSVLEVGRDFPLR